MAEAYSLLVNKSNQIANENSALKQTVEKLKLDAMVITLDELLNFSVAQDQPYLMSLKYLIIFIKYLTEAPKGVKYAGLSEHFIFALGIIPEDVRTPVSNSIIESYYSAFGKEIETNDIEELKIWIGVYGKIKAKDINVQGLDDGLFLRLNNIVSNYIEDDNVDISKATEMLKVIVLAQYNKFDVSEIASFIIGNLSSYLTLKFEIYKGGQRNDLRDHSLLIGQLKLLNTNIEPDVAQVKVLDDFFGSLNEQVEERPSKGKSSNKEFVRDPSLPYNSINFDTLVFKKNIYANAKHASFNVSVYHYTCPQNGEVALKVYEIKDPNYDPRRIINEIDILETLSAKSSPQNSFLKFIGSFKQNDSFYLMMEYHEKTLMDELTEMKKAQKRFTEEELITHATDLLSAFATMDEMRIYHQDIKPHNLLMTSYGKLKIIDFSVSESKSHDQSTATPTGLHYIQGTQGYMAPELQKHALSEIKEKVRFRKDRADVFSLGITLLQMYSMEELHTLNYPENNGKLMARVDQIQYTWLSTLLKSMLQLNFRERPKFRACCKYLPGRDTTTHHAPPK